MRYTFDQNGAPAGFSLKNAGETAWTEYYFVKNLQGDVLKVYKAADNSLAAAYTYEPFGKIRTSTGSLANTNPFRYRGYSYDAETGFYYLQSRYYDPITCRFINADGYVSTGNGVLEKNMFVYCQNNAMNKVDYNGNRPGDLFDTMDGAALDFALCYNEVSIADMQEYGSAIYRVKTTVKTTTTVTKTHRFLRWAWTTTSKKTVKTKKIQYSYTKPAIGKKGNSVMPNFLTTKPIVSTVHTHANYDPQYDNENFSTGFSSDIWWSNFFHMNSYVATPGGYLKKYTYANRKDENGGVSIISSDIPWDINSPDHIN